MDPLSAVLSTIRFEAAVSTRVRAHAPWAFVGARDDRAHFYVVVEGAARITSATESLLLAQGGVLLVAAGVAHTLFDTWNRRDGRLEQVVPWPAGTMVQVDGPGPATEIVAGCLAATGMEALPIWSALPPVMHVPVERVAALPMLEAAVRLLGDPTNTEGLGGAAIGSRIADVLVLDIVREQFRADDRESAWLDGLSDHRLAPALSAMHHAPQQPWTVEALARTAGMSRTAFATRFSARLGYAPLHYLTTLRMQRAATLLGSRAELSIAQVAESVGYASETAFQRAFKRWARVAPASYRRKLDNTD